MIQKERLKFSQIKFLLAKISNFVSITFEIGSTSIKNDRRSLPYNFRSGPFTFKVHISYFITRFILVPPLSESDDSELESLSIHLCDFKPVKGKQLLEICETFNITTSFQVQEDEITGAKACLNTNPNKTSNPTEAKETSVVNISAGNTYSKQRHLDEGMSRAPPGGQT